MTRRRARGFTLVEAAISIALLGIIAAAVAVFLRAPAEGYFDTARRAALTERADNAIRRIAREVQAALPNSVRLGPTDQCFEFLPTAGGGRYRGEPNGGGGGDILDFTILDNSFDVLASVALPDFAAAPSGAYHAVVYNLGIPGADAYAGDNREALSNTSTSGNFVLSSAKKFPFASPGRRVHVIGNQAAVYSCSGGQLLRSTRAISATPLATCPGSGALLASGVTGCAFEYAVVNARFGLLTVRLALTSAGETVTLYHEIHVDNVP